MQTAVGLLARFTTFGAILITVGAVVFRLYVLRRTLVSELTTQAASRRAAGIVIFAALTAIPASLVKLALQTADMRFPDDPWIAVALRLVTETKWGTTWLAGFATALLLIPAAAFAKRGSANGESAKRASANGRSLMSWVPVSVLAIALAVTPSTSSHAMSAHKLSAITVYTDVVHVFAASTWLGTLFVMYRSVRGGDSSNVADEYLPRLLAAFSPLALSCGALVVVSGLISSYSHIDTLGQLGTTRYGQTLVAKVASVAIIALFGWRNFRYLTPTLIKAGPAPMRRGMLLELLATVVVLLVTAALVVTPPPMDAMAMS